MPRTKPIEIWTDSFFLTKQKLPRLGLLEILGTAWMDWIEEILVSLFGPPVFHLWVLQELISACQKKLDDFQGTKLIIIDVRFHSTVINNLKTSIKNPNGEEYKSEVDLLGDLGYWFTEQLITWLARERITRSWPTVVVRCIECYPNDLLPSYKPEGRLLQLVNFLFQENSLLGIKFPLFEVFFPDPDFKPTLEISLLSPAVKNRMSLHKQLIDLGSELFFPYLSKIDVLCPLVSQHHASLVATHCPTNDNEVRFFVRHKETHETWIVVDNEFTQVPRDAWVPLPKNARIVLGRVTGASSFSASQDKMILRGSLIIKVEKPGN